DYAKSARPVSLAYGSGGAKRQRTIESAVLALGLPETLVHAGIRRPIYGVPMADNIGRVMWADETPHWTVPRGVTPEEYCQQAVALWRRRWLPNVVRRLNSPGRFVAGVMSTVSQCGIKSR